MTRRLYAVRLKEDKQIVSLTLVDDLFGEPHLAYQVDEFCTVRDCEYAELETFNIGWPDTAAAWSKWVTGSGEGERTAPSFSELMLRADEDLEWTPFNSGWVYFFVCDGAVKIGFSRDVASRLKTLQTASAKKIEFFGARPGSMADEAALHERFSEYRINGEWFQYSEICGDLLRLRRSGYLSTELPGISRPAVMEAKY
ncbi:GIY-YIG nuclease family protein [Tianweitania sediminis]|uniref:GIY-YIG nuclease family protein n=1 Tax=Tianweitania sediminis TaxID=1502156 RepID=A0A8J7RLL0_9HYPH|nr:GIY-YIG nuclease family protein [Tianweitania sediminis]MBP0440636.1 GIY-YIG nuclease family protein [Tianweitania sediminis]